MRTALTTLASGNACIQRQALARFRLDAPNAERLSCMSQERLSTRWEGEALLVRRDERLLDRIAAADIRRVILVCDGGDTPSDLSCAIIDLGAEHVILPADSGIVSCVHFERQGFWMQHPCVYWVESATHGCRRTCALACGCSGGLDRVMPGCRRPKSRP